MASMSRMDEACGDWLAARVLALAVEKEARVAAAAIMVAATSLRMGVSFFRPGISRSRVREQEVAARSRLLPFFSRPRRSPAFAPEKANDSATAGLDPSAGPGRPSPDHPAPRSMAMLAR